MKGQTAIVTGAGRGIGQAIALRFASRGANVVAAARTARELAETEAQALDAGAVCRPAVIDVADRGQIQRLVSETLNAFGTVDVLVNNAGSAVFAPPDEMDPQAFDQMVRVNVHGVFHACQAVWPIMTRQGSGVIINISSMAAIDPYPGLEAYGGTKAWVNTFTLGLAKRGRADNIRVYAIGPGATETVMLRSGLPDVPPEACLAPDDVAGLVEVLVDDRCRYVSGQVIYIRK